MCMLDYLPRRRRIDSSSLRTVKMYVCMYIHMYVCMASCHGLVATFVSMRACMCVCECECAFVYIHVCM
jgi:hypothetical protein